MFDRVEIKIKSGDGGDGAISFRREKYVPYGGPDGGDGGSGGNVIIMADDSLSSLRSFKPKGLYKAGNGGNGKGQKKHGKNGEDLIIKVPEGTVAINNDGSGDEAIVADCALPGEQTVLLRGGRGGLGNSHFASSTNQAPRIAQKGEPGSEMALTLELRLIADIGVIGFPNAGKSTLLDTASAARPKIADYAFTTLEPILGAIEVGQKCFVLAEIPGLIEGAHLGKGLGHDFLRHIMRTSVLIHLIDGTSESPVEDMTRVNTELALFDSTLAQKPQLIAINKIDLPRAEERLPDIRATFRSIKVPVMFISAVTGEGVGALMSEAMKLLEKAGTSMEAVESIQKAVFHPQPRGSGIRVSKEGDVFVLTAPELERIIARVDTSDAEVRRQVQRQLVRQGLNRVLEKAGIKPGDKVRCGDYGWEW